MSVADAMGRESTTYTYMRNLGPDPSIGAVLAAQTLALRWLRTAAESDRHSELDLSTFRLYIDVDQGDHILHARVSRADGQ